MLRKSFVALALLGLLLVFGTTTSFGTMTNVGDVAEASSSGNGDDEGCTPGFWKQKQHLTSWNNTGLTPTDQFDDVFGVAAFSGKNLLDVLNLGGGGLNALGRHTVAAILNAESEAVHYPFPPELVIIVFKATLAGKALSVEGLKDTFEIANEAGCPLSRDTGGID